MENIIRRIRNGEVDYCVIRYKITSPLAPDVVDLCEGGKMLGDDVHAQKARPGHDDAAVHGEEALLIDGLVGQQVHQHHGQHERRDYGGGNGPQEQRCVGNELSDTIAHKKISLVLFCIAKDLEAELRCIRIIAFLLVYPFAMVITLH